MNNQQKRNYYVPPYKRNDNIESDKDLNDKNNEDKQIINKTESKPLKIYKFDENYLSNNTINKQYNISVYNYSFQTKTNSYILKNTHNIDDNIFNFKEDNITNYKLNDIVVSKLSDNDYYIININNF